VRGTLRRVLIEIDADELDRRVGAWPRAHADCDTGLQAARELITALTVLVGISLIHYSESLFPDARTFAPSRFADARPDLCQWIACSERSSSRPAARRSARHTRPIPRSRGSSCSRRSRRTAEGQLTGSRSAESRSASAWRIAVRIASSTDVMRCQLQPGRRRAPSVAKRPSRPAARAISARPPGRGHPGRPASGRPGHRDQARSNRSRFMTLSHAATKSRTNFSCESSLA